LGERLPALLDRLAEAGPGAAPQAAAAPEAAGAAAQAAAAPQAAGAGAPAAAAVPEAAGAVPGALVPGGPAPDAAQPEQPPARAAGGRRSGLLLVGAAALATAAVVAAAALVAGAGAGSSAGGHRGPGVVPFASRTAGQQPGGVDPAALPAPATSGLAPSAGAATGTAAGSLPRPSAVAPSGGSPPDPPAPSAPPGDAGASWRAGYRTVRRGPDEYTGQITVTNAGPAAGADWSVRVTVGADALLAAVSGAGYARAGTSVTFGPAHGADPVPAGGSVAFTFRVTGDGRDGPLACAVDGRPCAASPPGRRNELVAARR
ncbi:MAG TPA: cellulose binding domain-containing protein, partial [Pilimelia sp.]|nr:cellulose binding domain-containing protein [Pilimelia sp.]